MKAFLFVWNPKKWNWAAINQGIDSINQNGYFTEKWSVISHRKIQQGDRVFLMRLGVEPKGLMASGYVSSPVFKDKHWNGSNKHINKDLIDFEILLNPETNNILDLDVLSVGGLNKVNWTPQSSGIWMQMCDLRFQL